MIRPPPISTRPDTLFPYPPHFRSAPAHLEYFRPPLADQIIAVRHHRPARRARAVKREGPHRGRARALDDARDLPDDIEHRLQRSQPVSRFDIAHQSAQRSGNIARRSEEHTSELQSLMRISYAVFCLKTKINIYIKR